LKFIGFPEILELITWNKDKVKLTLSFLIYYRIIGVKDLRILGVLRKIPLKSFNPKP